MKKIISILYLLSISFLSSFAQVSQGSKALGLTFFINSQKDQDDDFSDFSNFALIPNFRYFVQDKFSIGLGLGYQQNTSRGNEFKFTESLFVISPELRIYKNTSADNFYFFGQLRLVLGLGKEKDTFGSLSVENNLTTSSIFISPGFVYFPTQRWGIELLFTGIGFENRNPEGNNNNRSFFTLGLSSFSPSFGVNYYF